MEDYLSQKDKVGEVCTEVRVYVHVGYGCVHVCIYVQRTSSRSFLPYLLTIFFSYYGMLILF